MDRLKEIQHRRYEIICELKRLRKELIKLRNEEKELIGESKIKRRKYDNRKN